MIKNDQLDRARDLRDGLPKIIESGQELVKKLISGKIDYEEALTIAKERNDNTGSLKRLKVSGLGLKMLTYLFTSTIWTLEIKKHVNMKSKKLLPG